MTRSPEDLTRLLLLSRNGDKEAWEQFVALVYPELRRLAQNYMRRERKDHTLQPTALLHEALAEIMGKADKSWKDRGHFFAAAAQIMRWVLRDHARDKKRKKRDGGIRISFEDNLQWTGKKDIDVVALEDALESLSRQDPERARIVELRFFGGLTLEETAQVLNVSPSTVKREWNVAKAWLYRELTEKKEGDAA